MLKTISTFLIVLSATQFALASANQGAPEQSQPARIYNCQMNSIYSGEKAKTVRLSIFMNGSTATYIRVDVEYYTDISSRNGYKPGYDGWTVDIAGPIRRTRSGALGFKKGSVPIFSRADLVEVGFPELRTSNVATLPQTFRFEYHTVTGPVGQTGGSDEAGTCVFAGFQN